MTALTNYAENALLDHILSTTAWTMPTNTYVKLHTGDPGEDATLNAATEALRKVLSFGAAASAAIETDAAVDWDNVSTTETYSHFSIWDALTGGNPLCYGAFAASYSVTAGDDFQIPIGDIDLSFNTAMTTAAANAALDHLTGTSAWTMPVGTFVKLHTGAPGTAAAANAATETTRADGGAFSASVAGASDNDAAINWTSVSTSETITDFSVWDAVTAGSPLLIGALGTSRALTAGQDARFSAGALAVTLA